LPGIDLMKPFWPKFVIMYRYTGYGSGIDLMYLRFGRKAFRTNINPKILDKFSSQINRFCKYIWLLIYSGFYGILMPHKAIITNLDFAKLYFVGKLRPKLIHQIGSSLGSSPPTWPVTGSSGTRWHLQVNPTGRCL
jgi:hypothetical protein